MAKKRTDKTEDSASIHIKRIDKKTWQAYGVLCQMKGSDKTKEMRKLLENVIKSYAKDNPAFSDYLKTL